MKKDNVLFGIFGLIVGLVVGFVFANSVNKTTEAGSGPAGTQASMPGSNPAVPADHPPIPGQTGDVPTAPVPQVMESIEKAKQQPENYEAQMTAADLYYQIQRFDDAARYYEVAAKLRPNENEPVIKAGNANFDAEKYEDAEKWYVKALEKEPKNLNVLTDLGLTYYLREPRDIDQAIKQYNTALAIDPAHEITLQNLALAYKEKNDTANLRTTVEKLKKANPQNPALARLESAQ